MSRYLTLALAAASLVPLCACSTTAPITDAAHRSVISIYEPQGEPSDFVLCKDGRVLVFLTSHPQTCS
ncbi:hypothetical protein LFL96_36860 (plasmid) [Paraburkholderia sp. D15]|uniref:hypothetical protein n=1 Tax=Paraburkholderia sp. D15 TaxID=2880218 RepID=UPI00247A45DC|nr:hypothetical protein [Paraburkholderia sp. D15]WGS55050.1 hypothetical protein LFL96_36860 [Paraburkholderia sp. D15]